MSAQIRAGSPKQQPEVIVQADPPGKEEALAHPRLWGIEIRFLVLPLLTAQNASAVLLMRAVRSLPGQTDFSTQTAVIMQEVFKVIACVIIMMVTEGSLSQAWDKPREALKTVCELLFLEKKNCSKEDKKKKKKITVNPCDALLLPEQRSVRCRITFRRHHVHCVVSIKDFLERVSHIGMLSESCFFKILMQSRPGRKKKKK